ncbi:universal stress protein [Mucilaginibacter sp. BJC16-A38]|uniref:universal stress protein n=1 Tax=Mucilaginibacter phenanthrenivorans TaxID=1234842 RepID=UPI0021573C2D|nr:universal stress protein [Mucilaginibacter phenanthrenivorans]MCR8560803.1 universal stress protein [Mucilaginibacter phenanthrenivorans]
MKKILVLTNLGDLASHAALSAIPLSAKLNTNILLLHSWVTQTALVEYPNSSWGIDTLLYGERCKDKLELLTEHLQAEVDDLPDGVHHPSIDWQQEDGSVDHCASARLKKGDIELIIMGSPAGSSLDHLILGSDTALVINKADRPVLVVPAERGLEELTKVTFASDFSDGDIAAVHYLTRLGRKFNFHLEIVHVVVFGQDDSEAIERRKSFERHVAKFHYPNISYENIYGKNVIERLQRLCRENGSDLLVLSHDHRSFWNRLFKSTHSSEALKSQELPVLIIPASLDIINI